MTDAPERIWADGDETGLDGFCDWLWVRGSWNRSKEGVGEVEYIRADLVEALEAENQRLREALERIANQKRTDELVTVYDVEFADFEDGYDQCIDCARAALRSTEASHDD